MAKILVVDDEKLLVKGMKFNLENEGYEVECAYDGAAAVELARTRAFDLLILDVMMPEVDGLEACMRIREFSNVPIINEFLHRLLSLLLCLCNKFRCRCFWIQCLS